MRHIHRYTHARTQATPLTWRERAELLDFLESVGGALGAALDDLQRQRGSGAGPVLAPADCVAAVQVRACACVHASVRACACVRVCGRACVRALVGPAD